MKNISRDASDKVNKIPAKINYNVNDGLDVKQFVNIQNAVDKSSDDNLKENGN